MVVERLFAVRNDLHRDAVDANSLCRSPFPCSHVLRRHCSLTASVSAPTENPDYRGCSEQSDLNWPPGLTLRKLNEM